MEPNIAEIEKELIPVAPPPAAENGGRRRASDHPDLGVLGLLKCHAYFAGLP